MDEVPISYRVSWREYRGAPFDTANPPIDMHRDFQTREQALAEKKFLTDCFGEAAAVCLTPVYSRPKANRKAQQSYLTELGWPIQRRPRKA